MDLVVVITFVFIGILLCTGLTVWGWKAIGTWNREENLFSGSPDPPIPRDKTTH